MAAGKGSERLQDGAPAGGEGKPDPQQEARDRRAANIFLLTAAIVLIATGLWLVDEMIKAKRADDCMSAGRRNCSPVEIPAQR